ncbi:MAG: peptidylprolyl isomerase [Xanthomonadales bacterium]|nr:peptidylprolyl isomerase [Xanthomonadales bacterium]
MRLETLLNHYAGRSLVIAGAILMAPALFASEPMNQKTTEIEISYESDTVVRVGDVAITHADLDAHMSRLPESDRTQAVSSMERVDKLLQNLLLQKALFEQAQRNQLMESDSMAALAGNRVIAALADEQMKQHVESQMLDDYEQRAKEMFLADPQKFAPEPSYDFTHVLVSTADREEAEAMRRILDLHDRIEEGDSLDSLAAEYSDDEASREKGGSYKRQSLNRLDRNFARALSQLDQPGAVSGPVRSRFGWHLIRLDKRHDAAEPSWENARERAIQQAREQHRARIREAYSAELLNQDAIEVVPGSIERFQKRHGFDAEALQSLSSD